jgi:hypothetical protein
MRHGGRRDKRRQFDEAGERFSSSPKILCALCDLYGKRLSASRILDAVALTHTPQLMALMRSAEGAR